MKFVAGLFVLLGLLASCRTQEFTGEWKLRELRCQSGKPLNKQVKQVIDGQEVDVTTNLSGSLRIASSQVEVTSKMNLIYAPGTSAANNFPKGRECTITDVKSYSLTETEITMTTLSSTELCSDQKAARELPVEKRETTSRYTLAGNLLSIYNIPLEQDGLCPKGDSMISIFEK